MVLYRWVEQVYAELVEICCLFMEPIRDNNARFFFTIACARVKLISRSCVWFRFYSYAQDFQQTIVEYFFEPQEVLKSFTAVGIIFSENLVMLQSLFSDIRAILLNGKHAGRIKL